MIPPGKDRASAHGRRLPLACTFAHVDDQPEPTKRARIAAALRATVRALGEQPAILVVAGGALVVAGSFMSWITVTETVYDASGQPASHLDVAIVGYSLRNHHHLSWLVAILGVVLVVLGFLALAGLRTAGDLGVLAGVGATALSGYEIGWLNDGIGDVPIARVGLGLWVVLAGSLVAWLGGYLHTRRRPLSRAEALRLAR
jgi:hypothetical protein